MSNVILWVDVPATEVLTSNQRLHWGEQARRTRALRWRATLAYRLALYHAEAERLRAWLEAVA